MIPFVMVERHSVRTLWFSQIQLAYLVSILPFVLRSGINRSPPNFNR